MKRPFFIAALTAAALVGGQASAHHSGAMFDATKDVVFANATVKEFQWTNPHAWLEVTVPGANGKAETWSLELIALVGLQRQGWKHGTLKPGDKVKVAFNPMRDGTKGGRLNDITLADGRVLNGQGRPVGSTPGAAAAARAAGRPAGGAAPAGGY